MLAFQMAALLSSSCQPITYMRAPKTGSTTMLSILRPIEAVIMRDHADGCRHIQYCNGSTVTGVSVAALRDPYLRFESQLAHIAEKSPSVSMISILNQIKCTSFTTKCVVDEVNRVYKLFHRVVVWPQSVWIGASTLILCVSENPERTLTRWKRLLNGLGVHVNITSSTRKNAREHTTNTETHQKLVEKYYSEDVALWNSFCA